MIYEFDACVLDTTRQELMRSGEIVHVEPQVLAVLEYLVANHDRLITKVELLDEVWGDRFVSESALTSRIKLARKACGDSGREQRIVKTVHSRGYRVVADVVQRHSGSMTSSPSAAPTSASVGSFVGRADELVELDAALADVAGGERRSIFVTGVIGTGKSTLVSEALEHIDDPDSWIVLRGQCLQSRGGVEPYFCLLDALTELARRAPEVVLDTLERVAPSWLVQMPALVDDELAERLERRLLGSTPQRMVREGAEAFEELARRCPMVLVLEDLHWADEYTLDVIELLVQRASPVPVLVLGTTRAERTAIHDLIAAAVTGSRAVELRLDGLLLSEMDELVRDRFAGAEVPPELISVVQERCDGVPLFANEIITTWLRRGLATTDDGVVVTHTGTDELAATIPDTLHPLIERELNDLDNEARMALEAAAVAGVAFDTAAVAAGIGQPVADTEDLLSAVARRLDYIGAERGVTWPDGTRSTAYTFRHRLYRDVLYDLSPVGTRAELHGRIGEALEHGYADRLDDVALALAEHFVEAGDAARSIDYLRRAGERAAARGAHPEAVAFISQAMEIHSGLPVGKERDDMEIALRTAIGPALVAANGWFDGEVSANYERVLELCSGRPSCPESAAARYGLATVTELRGQFEQTEQLLSPLLEAEASGDLAMEAHELIACSLFHQGAFDRSLDNSEMVLESWDEEAYSVLMSKIAEHPASSCNSWASLAAWCLGRSDESLDLAKRAVELGERNRYSLSTAAQQRAMFHQLRAEPEDCEFWAGRTREIGHEQDFPMRIIQADIFRGWALGVTGSPNEGLHLIVDGLARFRAAEARLNEAYYLGLEADVLIHAGRPDDALEALDAAFERIGSSTRSYFFESELHRLRARALGALTEDSAEVVREALDASLMAARRQGSPALALRTAAHRLELEMESGDPEPWRHTVAELTGVFEGQAPTSDVDRAHHLLTL